MGAMTVPGGAAYAPLLALTAFIVVLLPGPVAAHDSGPHELADCVAVSKETRPGNRVEFEFTNNCTYGVHVSYCWEYPDERRAPWDGPIECANTSQRNRTLAPGETVRLEDWAKPDSRFWSAACRMDFYSLDTMQAAHRFCGLGRGDGSQVIMGLVEHERQVYP